LGRGLLELQGKHPSGCFPWPEGDLRAMHGRNPRELRIGIPQGAAISGLIANLVLDAADKAVMKVAQGHEEDLFYRRFCDDMLLVSRDRILCQDAFQAYQAAVKALRLPIYEPETSSDYRRQFWQLKSKDVYPWGPDSLNHAGRVGFVGYQLRFDGQARIRPTTVKKHLEKLTREAARLQALVKAGHLPRASKQRIFFSLAWRIVAMSTGRRPDTDNSPLGRSWCQSFSVLRDLPFDRPQIESLDRFRNKLIGQLCGAVIHLPDGGVKRTKSKASSRGRGLPELRGYRHSYMAFFESGRSRS
ncbi:MAG: hypothetical protein KDL87_15105, partial [Verrucomicrobiae bacterium]|nr:hypothetical protein [Verrucomicrobiae bacterium]